MFLLAPRMGVQFFEEEEGGDELWVNIRKQWATSKNLSFYQVDFVR